jgi:hypothetical protein
MHKYAAQRGTGALVFFILEQAQNHLQRGDEDDDDQRARQPVFDHLVRGELGLTRRRRE